MGCDPPLQCSWHKPGWSWSNIAPPLSNIACAHGIPAMDVLPAGADGIAQAYAAVASCRNSSEAISHLDHQVRSVRVKRMVPRS